MQPKMALACSWSATRHLPSVALAVPWQEGEMRLFEVRDYKVLRACTLCWLQRVTTCNCLLTNKPTAPLGSSQSWSNTWKLYKWQFCRNRTLCFMTRLVPVWLSNTLLWGMEIWCLVCFFLVLDLIFILAICTVCRSPLYMLNAFKSVLHWIIFLKGYSQAKNMLYTSGK